MAGKNKTHYVFSTLATDVEYVDWIKGGGDLPTKGHSVIITGGAGIATKNLVTPRGVVTAVDDEDITLLKSNPVFLAHEKNGHMKIQAKHADPEKVAADMTGRDPGAPLVPQDFKKADPQPTTEAVA